MPESVGRSVAHPPPHPARLGPAGHRSPICTGDRAARRLRLPAPPNLCDRPGLGSKGQRLGGGGGTPKEQACDTEALGSPKGREPTVPERKLWKGEGGLSSYREHRH